jgi:hypothetical protein
MNFPSLNLTLEQQFQMRLIQESAEQMSREQMQEMVLQLAQLLMVKDNVIRDLVKGCLI